MQREVGAFVIDSLFNMFYSLCLCALQYIQYKYVKFVNSFFFNLFIFYFKNLVCYLNWGEKECFWDVVYLMAINRLCLNRNQIIKIYKDLRFYLSLLHWADYRRTVFSVIKINPYSFKLSVPWPLNVTYVLYVCDLS